MLTVAGGLPRGTPLSPVRIVSSVLTPVPAGRADRDDPAVPDSRQERGVQARGGSRSAGYLDVDHGRVAVDDLELAAVLVLVAPTRCSAREGGEFALALLSALAFAFHLALLGGHARVVPLPGDRQGEVAVELLPRLSANAGLAGEGHLREAVAVRLGEAHQPEDRGVSEAASTNHPSQLAGDPAVERLDEVRVSGEARDVPVPRVFRRL